MFPVCESDYQAVDRIGGGQHADVFLLMDDDSELFVLKQYTNPAGKSNLLKSIEHRRFIDRELVALERLNNNCQNDANDPACSIVKVVCVGPNAAVPEYWISKYQEQAIDDVRALSENEKRQVAARLVKVLEFMHREGLMHTDVKPENLLITKNDASLSTNNTSTNSTATNGSVNGLVVTLVDFEYTQDLNRGFIKAGGTNRFMSPLMFNCFMQFTTGADCYELNESDDWFSFGLTVLAMYQEMDGIPAMEWFPSPLDMPLPHAQDQQAGFYIPSPPLQIPYKTYVPVDAKELIEYLLDSGRNARRLERTGNIVELKSLNYFNNTDIYIAANSTDTDTDAATSTKTAETKAGSICQGFSVFTKIPDCSVLSLDCFRQIPVSATDNSSKLTICLNGLNEHVLSNLLPSDLSRFNPTVLMKFDRCNQVSLETLSFLISLPKYTENHISLCKRNIIHLVDNSNYAVLKEAIDHFTIQNLRDCSLIADFQDYEKLIMRYLKTDCVAQIKPKTFETIDYMRFLLLRPETFVNLNEEQLNAIPGIFFNALTKSQLKLWIEEKGKETVCKVLERVDKMEEPLIDLVKPHCSVEKRESLLGMYMLIVVFVLPLFLLLRRKTNQ